MKNIAIIGAGMAGLSAAHFLKDQANVTIFDKSRGVGGRMSTRRAEPYYFDHGAQYFSARTKEFQNFVASLITQGFVEQWNPKLVEISNRQAQIKKIEKKDSFYVGVKGMNAICKYLAKDFKVNLSAKITSVSKDKDAWKLIDENSDNVGIFDWVICAIPVHQALDILPDNFNNYTELQSKKMKGCFALMLGIKNPPRFEFDAARVFDEDISWIAVNSSKPGRIGNFSMLVHSTNEWADENMDNDRDVSMEYLMEQTSQIVGYDVSKADYKTLHAWRYANIGGQSGPTHYTNAELRISACGDWCIEGRVEAAFLSGSATAQAILEDL